MTKVLNQIENVFLVITIFFVPLLVLPIFPEPYLTPKILLLAFTILVILLIKIIKILFLRQLNFSTSSFDLPIFLFLLAILISALFKSPNKYEAFFVPGNATVILETGVLYFLVNQSKTKDKKNLLLVIIISSIIISLISLLTITKLNNQVSILPEIFKVQGFSPIHGNLPTLLLLITIFPLAIGEIISKKDFSQKYLFFLTSLLIFIGIALNLNNILPGKPNFSQTQGLKTSWSIAINSLKESPFLGVGPGNYLTAFNRFRPIAFNQTSLWPIKFTVANSFFLTILTEGGILSFLPLALLSFLIIQSLFKISQENKLGENTKINSYKSVSLGLSSCFLVLFEANISLLTLFFILLAVNSKTHKLSLNFKNEDLAEGKTAFISYLFSIIIVIPLIALVIFSAFFLGKTAYAERLYAKSQNALTKNQGKSTYDFLVKAIQVNPKVDKYHMSFANLNFALANSIVKKPENRELTENERNSVSTLIQQSISEGKAGIALNPSRSGNWVLLASIYQSIIPFVQGADTFTIQTYSQAIYLDPLNPILRVSLGQVLFSLKKYDEAIKAFKGATYAKNDYANAHYNLAICYREKGEIDKAITEMTYVLSLTTKNSSKDYKIAKKELESLETKKPVKETTSGENLTPPRSADNPIVEPPIELPKEAKPPLSSTTPENSLYITSPTP